MSVDLLYRDSLLVRADNAGRTVYGTAVPYGQIAEIQEGGRVFRERFEYGSFARTIKLRGDKVRLFTGHQHQRLPIGRASELTEMRDGLHVSFLVSDTTEGNEALTLVRDGVVSSFSVGIKPISERMDGDVLVRTEVALYEVSLVGMPAYEGAAIAGVRTARQPLSVDLARRRLELLIFDW
ncbi:HK97 family phage prohead protease [Streptomyces sp. NBC_00885]|uniref:HK97 family phage prohead protease n=1 Tax=Streptomyces sp. NBC_00885 TaxID=2975857 RepID=UPI00386CA94E|nr:HK97 family phage prohead protease [Streptomyces sp. NBC_00885]